MQHDNAKLRLSLEDVLADLWNARRKEDFARLSFVIYWDLRRWARVAGEELLAQRSEELLLNCPHAGRQEFVLAIDRLIGDAEQVHAKLSPASSDANRLGVSTEVDAAVLQAVS